MSLFNLFLPLPLPSWSDLKVELVTLKDAVLDTPRIHPGLARQEYIWLGPTTMMVKLSSTRHFEPLLVTCALPEACKARRTNGRGGDLVTTEDFRLGTFLLEYHWLMLHGNRFSVHSHVGFKAKSFIENVIEGIIESVTYSSFPGNPYR